MQLFINGQPYNIANKFNQNIGQALTLYLDEDQLKRSFAVALNGDFVGKSDYETTTIKANDSIDILFPIQGG